METFSALLAICAGNVSDEFPAQWPVTPSFDTFFDLRLNKRLSKQSWGWWCMYRQICWYAKNILIIFMIMIVLINEICWFFEIGLQMTMYGNYELQFIFYTMTVDYNTKIDG